MNRRTWILFWFLSVVWGLPYLLIRIAVAEVPVPVLVFCRVAIAAAILWPLAARERSYRVLRAHWKPLLAFSLLEFAAPWGLLSHAEKNLSSSMAGLLMASIPILTVLISYLSGDRERLGLRRTAGLGVGLLGVVLLASPTLAGDATSSLEVLLAAACYAAGALVAARGLRNVPSLSMMAVCLTLASVVYAIPAALAWPETWPSTTAVMAILALAFVCTALAFVGYVALIRNAGVSRAVVITYLNPAVAGAAGVIVLGEPLTVTSACAFGLILIGSLLAAGANARRTADEPAHGHGSVQENELSSAGGSERGARRINAGSECGAGRARPRTVSAPARTAA